MTEPKNITVADITSEEKLKKLLWEQRPSVCCIFPGAPPVNEELQKAALIVTSGNPAGIIPLLKNRHLPEYTPILHLVSDQEDPAIENFRAYDRLIDCLTVPVSSQILFHKIDFLIKVQKINIELHANKTTLSQQLNYLTTRDGLTGLYNRRQLTKRLTQCFQHAITTGEQLSLLLLNIDYFSSINKTWGLEFGDTILNEMAARLTETTGSTAACYRFSGEDFVVLLPGTSLQEGCKKATLIRKICSEKPFTDGRSKISLTISVGIASLQDHRPDNYDEFITMAEAALFMAKAEGRNRLQIYVPHNNQEEFSSQKSLTLLKENLERILEKTKTSTIASLQLLAKNSAGVSHQDHIDNVSHYMTLLGKQLGLPEQHTQTFKNAITLYNSFRFLLHNGLLTKSGSLTRHERRTIEDLPFKLNELTDMFDYFREERNVLLSHNEHYDGTGYPFGLRGDEISLGARIFNIVDSLAAMNSERPYRRRLSPTEIIDELKKEAGKQFDPYLVLQILAVIKKHKILQLEPDYLDQAQQELINIFPELKI